jgi:hypothetical protein
MKLFVVIGVMEHEYTEILGIYDSLESAEKRKDNYPHVWFDAITIEEIPLNTDIRNDD